MTYRLCSGSLALRYDCADFELKLPNMKKVILIADTDEPLLRILQRTLESRGFAARVVGDGPSLRKSLEEGSHDLVLLSPRVPDDSPAETAARARTGNSAAPILLMTGGPDSELMAQWRELRAHGPMLKPFTMDALETEIRRLLGSAS